MVGQGAQTSTISRGVDRDVLVHECVQHTSACSANLCGPREMEVPQLHQMPPARLTLATGSGRSAALAIGSRAWVTREGLDTAKLNYYSAGSSSTRSRCPSPLVPSQAVYLNAEPRLRSRWREPRILLPGDHVVSRAGLQESEAFLLNAASPRLVHPECAQRVDELLEYVVHRAPGLRRCPTRTIRRRPGQ